jgi:L-threonylcarbamoyladenylate synthase
VKINPAAFTRGELSQAVEWLRRGGILAFPTDTFYGLAADPSSSRAIRDLFDLKGRDAATAVPLIAGALEQVETWRGPLDPRSARLARACWPGPLSLVVDAPASVAPEVHGGLGTVAIRVPAHALARELAMLWGAPLTATSANRSGEAPARDATALGEVGSDPRVMVVDGGPTPGGAPSTIVDARVDPPRLVRAGAMAWDRVLEFAKE